MGAIQPAPADQAALDEAALGFTQDINQASHGFSVGDPIYYDLDGNVWDDADAGSAATAGDEGRLGLIDAVADVNNFTVRFGGPLTLNAHGYEVGANIFLGDGGGLSATAPGSGKVVRKVAEVIDANTLFIDIDTGYVAE